MKIKDFRLEISKICSDFIVIKYYGHEIICIERNGGSMFIDDDILIGEVDDCIMGCFYNCKTGDWKNTIF